MPAPQVNTTDTGRGFITLLPLLLSKTTLDGEPGQYITEEGQDIFFAVL